MLDLKLKHSEKVSEICSEIADSMGWNENGDNWMAHAGLLHDVGKFPQYSKYGTFFDSISVDHGISQGRNTLKKEFNWDGIPIISEKMSSLLLCSTTKSSANRH